MKESTFTGKMPFKDKVILITGAASGIGAATALKFTDLNAQVALVDKDEENLKRALEECEKISGRKHLAIIADLNIHADVLTVVPKTVDHFGKIDVLVNCAGVISRENITDEDVAEIFDRLIAINLKAPIVLTNKASPYLIQTKGNIINISSIRSSRPNDCSPIYSTSKAGLEMFTKCVALDLADRGVRANSIHPGAVRTNIASNSNVSKKAEPHYKESIKHKLPFGLMEPDEIAKLIVFLANNEDARSITGASYYIDRGISLMETKSLGGKY